MIKINLLNSPMGVSPRASWSSCSGSNTRQFIFMLEISLLGIGLNFLTVTLKRRNCSRLSSSFLDVHLLEKQLIIWLVRDWHLLGKTSLRGRILPWKGMCVHGCILCSSFFTWLQLLTDWHTWFEENGTGSSAWVSWSEWHLPVYLFSTRKKPCLLRGTHHTPSCG